MFIHRNCIAISFKDSSIETTNYVFELKMINIYSSEHLDYKISITKSNQQLFKNLCKMANFHRPHFMRM